jgi:para-nitrobenzyl esterase
MGAEAGHLEACVFLQKERTFNMRTLLKTAALALALGVAAPALAAPAYSTADTDIGTLIDTPATRAILDKIMPGFASNDQVAMARPMTLRAIQQYAPDQITTAKLDALDAELAKLPVAK